MEDEEGIGDEVTGGEAAGLGAEPEEPFEAAALEPTRRLADAARVKIERGADADEHGGVEHGGVLGHKFFLLRRAEADPDDIGAEARDLGAESGVLLGGGRAIGRGKRAGHVETGETRGEFLAERFGYAGCAAVEVVAQANGATRVADGEEEIGAVDAFGAGRAQPNERHAVGRSQPRVVIDFLQRGIALGEGESVGGAEADVALVKLTAGGDNGIAGLREAEGGHADAEDVVTRHRRLAHGGKRGNGIGSPQAHAESVTYWVTLSGRTVRLPGVEGTDGREVEGGSCAGRQERQGGGFLWQLSVFSMSA